MKSKQSKAGVPAPDEARVAETFPKRKMKPVGKKQVIFLRVVSTEKSAIELAAASVGLTVTEYLLRCHDVVSEKLAERDAK